MFPKYLQFPWNFRCSINIYNFIDENESRIDFNCEFKLEIIINKILYGTINTNPSSNR